MAFLVKKSERRGIPEGFGSVKGPAALVAKELLTLK